MLTQLFIKNYALIKELYVTPSTKLNIITGETGAGKSIMLGAVGLLLGNRADTKSLLNEGEKCVIEGHFDLSGHQLEKLFKKEDLDYESLCIIRREISPSGKSRAFVNDTPVTLDILKKLGIKLMDIHSQHETLQLGKNSFQLKFIDVFAQIIPLRNEYFQAFQQYKKAYNQLEALQKEQVAASKEHDYNTFILNELSDAKLKVDEQEPLEETVKLMENAEEIHSKLTESIQLITGEEISISNLMQQLRQNLAQLARISEHYQSLSERTESALIEINDITQELEREETKVEFNPEEAQMAQDRLGLIYDLQKKTSGKWYSRVT